MVKSKVRQESESEDSEYNDSDQELQEAFVQGKLKPGLNEIAERPKKAFINNVRELKDKLNEFKLKLPWIETLDVISKEAPLAPELAAQLHEQEQRRANQLKNNAKLPQFASSDDPILNDFKREMIFHRQAQATILEAIPKLKSLGLATKRPEDYFAEMAKTDEHMQKIRKVLMKHEAQTKVRERVRQLRIQRKEGKALQIQTKLERQKKKKEMIEQVKKVRKGVSKNLDFLNDGKGNKKNKPGTSKKAIERRKMKNAKFGFGGRKKGSKRNTKTSSMDVSGYTPSRKPRNNRDMKKRPGKTSRQKIKAKRK